MRQRALMIGVHQPHGYPGIEPPRRAKIVERPDLRSAVTLPASQIAVRFLLCVDFPLPAACSNRCLPVSTLFVDCLVVRPIDVCQAHQSAPFRIARLLFVAEHLRPQPLLFPQLMSQSPWVEHLAFP